MQACYTHMGLNADFPVSEEIFSQGISLPSSYNLTDKDQEYVINSILQFYANK